MVFASVYAADRRGLGWSDLRSTAVSSDRLLHPDIECFRGAYDLDYFKLPEGRWILFTILSLTTPLYETSKAKIKYRLVSTLIGSIIIVILFGIFTNQTARLLIVMITGYLQSYVNEYKYRMIFVTVCAIGTAAVVGNVQELTLERILIDRKSTRLNSSHVF